MNLISIIITNLFLNFVMLVLLTIKIIILNYFMSFCLLDSVLFLSYKIILTYWLYTHAYMLLVGLLMLCFYYIYNYMQK